MAITKIDKQIIDSLEKKIEKNMNYLDFLGKDTKEFTHGYHTYPAMMIPFIAREFIELTMNCEKNIKKLYDPFMGSGTSLVEGMINNLEVTGCDVNPLSVLMSKAKTTAINPEKIDVSNKKIKAAISATYSLYKRGEYIVKNKPEFDRIDFWFKPYIIDLLQIIKDEILLVSDDCLRNFYLSIFSETVRHVSNTRNNEFKLYRINKEKLSEWNPDVIETFFTYLQRNTNGNSNLYNKLKELNCMHPRVNIIQDSNIKVGRKFKDEFDLVVTSPPYGDSHTTVAYGQFSRLSLQWLDLKLTDDKKIKQLDNIMLGGTVDKNANVVEVLRKLDSKELTNIYYAIAEKDEKRAREVLQFYKDLDKSICATTNAMKTGTYQFWVVANRTVKLIKVPTDKIITELFRKYNVLHLHSFYRNIPNKRMPSKNSPTNKIGSHVATMNSEIILMLRKL